MSLRRARLRLLLLNLGSLLLLLLLISLGAYGLLRRQLYARLEQDLMLTAQAVTFSVEHEEAGFDFSESIYLANRPLEFNLDHLVTAEWLDPQGKVLARRGSIAMPAQALQAERYVFGPDSCSYTLAASAKGWIYGYARVAVPLQPLRDQLTELVHLLLATGLITMAVAAGLGWWWTGRSLRPLQQAYDDLSLFTGSVSHELRSPLTAMLTQSQSLLRHYDRIDREEVREGLEELSQSSADMAHLVNDLLMLAQARRHPSDLELEWLDLTEVVESLRVQLGERIQCQASGGKVRAHRPYLVLILRNLLENALKYSESEKPVRVARVGSEIVVSDQGVGLSEEAQALVFEPFWRADSSRARHAGGSGLGLAIAYSLAEAMGGKLSVTSQPGQGSQFHLRLP